MKEGRIPNSIHQFYQWYIASTVNTALLLTQPKFNRQAYKLRYNGGTVWIAARVQGSSASRWPSLCCKEQS